VGGLAGALNRLGITSDADLKRAAESTRRLYEEVRAAGGSAREQGAAFQAMAEAAIAANNGVASSFVQTQAAIHGFEISTDRAGRAIVRAMGDGRAAVDDYRQGVEQATRAVETLATANDRYSRPKGGSTTGNTREQRLAGQNAVDNSLQFSLRDKLNAGTLSEADRADIENVLASLAQRQQIDRSVDALNPSGFSLEGTADRREWEAVRTRLTQALGGLNAAASRNVRLELVNGNQRETVNTDDAGAAAVIRTFQGASLAAR
jgi:hypothetical protein